MNKTWADFGIELKPGSVGEVDVLCPQCSAHRKKRKDPCLSVNVEKGVWTCWHCQWAGSLHAGEQEKSDPLSWRPKEYHRPRYEPNLLGKAAEWLRGRGLTDAVIARHKLGYQPVYFPQLEARAMAICFPYLRAGEVVNIKFRDGKKNFRQVPHAECIVYGFDDIEDGRLIWTEGEMDKLSVEVAGIRSCVSVPDGAPNPDAKSYAAKFDFLESCQDRLDRVQHHVLAVDNDAPGRKLEEELARRLGREKCSRVQWPSGCKDANDVLVKHGSAHLARCIAEARPYPVDGIYDVLDAGDKVYALHQDGLVKGERTGWAGLDGLYSVRPGEWTVVTGTPGSGKSSWIDALMVNLAHLAGWVFGVCSPENQPMERHIVGLLERITGKPFDPGPTPRMSLDDVDEALAWAQEHFHFIMPPESEFNLTNILDLAKVLVYRAGIRGLVIDPWNELEHARPREMTETEYISVCLGKLRRFARQHGVHVWLVAHPTKLRRDKDGKFPVPTPYDISGGAHWNNKSDCAITVWRDPDAFNSRETTIYVQKIRFKEVGQVGECTLRYDLVTGRYYDRDLAPGPAPLTGKAGGV